MENLNMIKIVGLVVLLAIALTLPAVLPKSDEAGELRGGVQVHGNEVQKMGAV